MDIEAELKRIHSEIQSTGNRACELSKYLVKEGYTLPAVKLVKAVVDLIAAKDAVDMLIISYTAVKRSENAENN